MTLLTKLSIGLQRLVDCSPDGTRERNDIGFDSADLVVGTSLARSYPAWTCKQADIAHRIAARYRNTQLSDLDIPAWPNAQLASAEVDAIRAKESAETANLPEWGLRWGSPKTVSTKHGLRTLRTSPPTQAFWTEWKASPEGMKAKGYSVSREGSAWVVLHWGVPTPAPEPEIDPKPLPATLAIPASKLLDFQIPAVRVLTRALQLHGVALDASDTGTGKTYMALATMKSNGIEPLVITPKSVMDDWQRAARHFGMRIRAINYEKVRAGNTPYGKWEQVDYRGRQIDQFVWAKDIKGVVFDECHRCKGQKTQNAQLMIAAVFQRIPTLAASATAVSNPLEMRALGYMMGLHRLSDYWQWIEAHGCHRNNWDGWEFGGSEQDLQSIRSQIFPEKGARIRVADLGDRFPKSLITTKLVEVQSPEKLSAAYKALADAFARIEDIKKDDKDGASHLTEMLRARQVSEAQKIPAFIDLANDALDEGRSVVLAVQFNETIKLLVEAMVKRSKVSVIHGTQTTDERTLSIAEFQANRNHVMVLNLRAGGVGVSLHDLHGRPRTAIISPSWSAVDLQQVLGRVWRAGGKSGSVQYIVYALGTVEEQVAEGLEKKLRRLRTFNDGLESLDITDKDL